jgi:hypothetical protein
MGLISIDGRRREERQVVDADWEVICLLQG